MDRSKVADFMAANRGQVTAAKVGELPWTERPPELTCQHCRFASRERAHPTDLQGVLLCRHGPKMLTSLPQQNGQIIGIGAWPQMQPGEWCYQFAAREVTLAAD